VTQNEQTVHCDVLTDSGETLDDSSGQSDTEQSVCILGGKDSDHAVENSKGLTEEDNRVTQNKQAVKLDVLTDRGETLEGISGHSDTEQIDGSRTGVGKAPPPPTL
jgi:hypothetical protein